MDVKLPNLGESADSGVVVNLLVKEGDKVEKDQTLLELENEKAVASIPSPVAGRVTRLRVKEGDRVSVGQLLVSIEEAETGAAGRPQTAAQAEEQGARLVTKEPSIAAAAVLPKEDEREAPEAGSAAAPTAAPSLRRLARDLGLDLTKVRGSERGGRIVLGDLRAYIQRLQQLAQPAADEKGRKPAPPPDRIDFARWGPIAKRPLSPMRRTISRRMAESWMTIPHVTQFHEADISVVDEWRRKYASAYEAKGLRLTLTGFVLKAVVTALKSHPSFNASLDETAEELVCKEYYHLGLAVDTEAGLLVPVLRDADKKSLSQLSKEIQELSTKARERKVTAEELKGGSFTISNQGGIGGGLFTPIINKPEVAILGLGRSAMKPMARAGKIEPRLMLPLAVSYDHRVIDGGSAARFIVDLAEALENFPEEAARL